MFDYENVPLHWVNRLGFLVRKTMGTAFQDNGFSVSPEEWAILLVLGKRGPLAPSALADVTFKDRTTVTRLVDAMVRKGFVARSEDPDDRRRSVVSVTEKGDALREQLVPIAQMLIANATAGILPEDIATTTKTLRAMTDNLSGRATKPGLANQTEDQR